MEQQPSRNVSSPPLTPKGSAKSLATKKEFKRELVWFCLCVIACFLFGGVSAWIATTEDFDRGARHDDTTLDYKAMHEAANKDFWSYGAMTAAGGSIPVYCVLFGIRLLIWRFRHDD